MEKRDYDSERKKQNYLFSELKYELENKDSGGQYLFFPGIHAERKNNTNRKNYDNTKNLFDNDPELF